MLTPRLCRGPSEGQRPVRRRPMKGDEALVLAREVVGVVQVLEALRQLRVAVAVAELLDRALRSRGDRHLGHPAVAIRGARGWPWPRRGPLACTAPSLLGQ